MNNYNWHGLLHGYFFIIIQIDWPFCRNHLGQIPLVLLLLYRNCPLIFHQTCSFSKHFILFPRLIYRCFITLFSTSIFDCNFEIFSSFKFVSCVLKSEYELLILIYIDILQSNIFLLVLSNEFNKYLSNNVLSNRSIQSFKKSFLLAYCLPKKSKQRNHTADWAQDILTKALIWGLVIMLLLRPCSSSFSFLVCKWISKASVTPDLS